MYEALSRETSSVGTRSLKSWFRTTKSSSTTDRLTQWGLDIMSPFLIAIRQLKFPVVGIDYFSKWVEVEALTTIMEKNVRSFVWRNIIYWYEIPRVLVLDNRMQFHNGLSYSMGFRHYEPVPNSNKATKVTSGWHRLLFQMGGS